MGPPACMAGLKGQAGGHKAPVTVRIPQARLRIGIAGARPPPESAGRCCATFRRPPPPAASPAGFRLLPPGWRQVCLTGPDGAVPQAWLRLGSWECGPRTWSGWSPFRRWAAVGAGLLCELLDEHVPDFKFSRLAGPVRRWGLRTVVRFKLAPEPVRVQRCRWSSNSIVRKGPRMGRAAGPVNHPHSAGPSTKPATVRFVQKK